MLTVLLLIIIMQQSVTITEFNEEKTYNTDKMR